MQREIPIYKVQHRSCNLRLLFVTQSNWLPPTRRNISTLPAVLTADRRYTGRARLFSGSFSRENGSSIEQRSPAKRRVESLKRKRGGERERENSHENHLLPFPSDVFVLSDHSVHLLSPFHIRVDRSSTTYYYYCALADAAAVAHCSRCPSP